jgi:hypothetical protein
VILGAEWVIGMGVGNVGFQKISFREEGRNEASASVLRFSAGCTIPQQLTRTTRVLCPRYVANGRFCLPREFEFGALCWEQS